MSAFSSAVRPLISRFSSALSSPILGAEVSEQVKNESFGFAGYSHLISERVGEGKKATLLIST